VPDWTVFQDNGADVGYILFNDHIATAEGWLYDAITDMVNANVDDLILDMRYNGGGYLDIASELAYMIGNTTLTNGQNFEKLVFNSKHPSTNPVTGQAISPTPFWKRSQGFDPALPNNTVLPSLNLSRVYIITGSGTCSASESVINSLRGVGVQVYLIGSTTCGKPYGFYPTDNCGTTYFSIQFRGENAANFGDYSDGFLAGQHDRQQGHLGSGLFGGLTTSRTNCSIPPSAEPALRSISEPETTSHRRARQRPAPPIRESRRPSFQDAPDRNLWVSRPAARMNRILRRN
jgi:hypothetical protein